MLEDHEDHLTDQLDYRFERKTSTDCQSAVRDCPGTDRLTGDESGIHQQTTALRAEMNESTLLKNRDKTDERTRRIQESNEVRPEQMRQTVEENWRNLAAPLADLLSGILLSKQLSRSTSGWEKASGAGCRNSLMVPPTPRRVIMANCSWVKSLNILTPSPV